jgi:hypothetical protein
MTAIQRKRLTTREPEDFEGKERFMEWVKENSVEEGDCWTWQGTVNRTIGVATHKNQSAHGYIFKKLNDLTGKDPKTLGRIFRTCTNLKCVNPSHCYIAQGPATKKAIKQEKRIEAIRKAEDGSALTDSETHVNKLTQTITNAVRKEIRNLSGVIIEGVVAELLRIRFDEMIAEQVAKKGGRR